MKHLFTLLLVAILAPVASVSAQDTLKIKGQEKALVVKVLSVMEGSLLYSDFVSQETGTVRVSKIERLVVKDEARRMQLSDADEDVKRLIQASSPKEFVARMMMKDDLSFALTWSQHLDRAAANYDGAAICWVLSGVATAVPLFSKSSNESLPQIMGGVSIGFGVAGLVMYLAGNGHLRKAAMKSQSARVGLTNTPTGLGVAFRIN